MSIILGDIEDYILKHHFTQVLDIEESERNTYHVVVILSLHPWLFVFPLMFVFV